MQLRNHTQTFYTLQHLSDHGWQFLADDLLTLTSNPARAKQYSSFTDAVAAAHEIVATEYHIEVVRVRTYSEWTQPTALKRRAFA